MLCEAALHSGESMGEEEFSTSLASMRLCRATRSEKIGGSGTGAGTGTGTPATTTSGLSAEQARRSLFAQRSEAAGLITTFLWDMKRLFRNRLLKYVRCVFRRCSCSLVSLLISHSTAVRLWPCLYRLVKVLQQRFRVHRAVGQARTHLLTAWCERHLPALLLHVRIVSAGRGLDLKNITTNDRENIRLAQQQYHQDYRYTAPSGDPVAVPLQPAGTLRPSDPPPGSSAGASRRGSVADGMQPALPAPVPVPGPVPAKQKMAQYRRLDSSLLRAMFSASFHAFLRAHLDLIASSGFVACNSVVSPTPGALSSHQRQVIARQQALHAKALALVFRKRREFVLRTTKRAEVVYERFEASLEAVQRFVHGGEDPLTLHLLEQRRREMVHREMRRHRKLGSRRRTGHENPNGCPEPAMTQPSCDHPNRPRAGTADLDGEETPPAGVGVLTKGVSFKRHPAEASTGSVLVGSVSAGSRHPLVSPGTLSRGNSFKRSLSKSGNANLPTSTATASATGPASPGTLSRGSSFKRSVSKSGKANPLTNGPVQDETPLSLPLPEVFLLLRSVSAEELALLYFDVSDQLRRAAAARDGTGSKRRQPRPVHTGEQQFDVYYSASTGQRSGADVTEDDYIPPALAVASMQHLPGSRQQQHLNHRKQSSASWDRLNSAQLHHQPRAPTGRPSLTQQQHIVYPTGPISKQVHIA